VYEATHDWTQRRVALKIMHARYGGRPDLIERFRKEALALSAIAHPNVVTVENGGLTDDGYVFLATQMLEGETLRQVLRERKRLPIGDALEILIQVARGVAAAHAQNVIHRDLKPENVFCTSEGTVKVLDLGIAKLIGYDTKETDPNLGFVAGTPAYMAPELLEAKSVGVTADVYALGVIAYECLAGHHPLSPDGVWPAPAELARRALGYDPPPLAGVPPELSALVGRALHKSAPRRQASMAELLEGLERVHQRWLQSETMQVASSSPPSRRRRALSSAAIVSLFALGVTAAAYHARQSAPPRPASLFLSAKRPAAVFAPSTTSALLNTVSSTPPALASVTPTLLPAARAGARSAEPPVKPRAGRRPPSRLIVRTLDADGESLAKPTIAPQKTHPSR
jgi:serine/threonine-protein kinase